MICNVREQGKQKPSDEIDRKEGKMSFVTSDKMLADAQRGRYAVGAFNVENMEMIKAVIAAAEEAQAPVMLQTTCLLYTSPSPRDA